MPAGSRQPGDPTFVFMRGRAAGIGPVRGAFPLFPPEIPRRTRGLFFCLRTDGKQGQILKKRRKEK